MIEQLSHMVQELFMLPSISQGATLGDFLFVTQVSHREGNFRTDGYYDNSLTSVEWGNPSRWPLKVVWMTVKSDCKEKGNNNYNKAL